MKWYARAGIFVAGILSVFGAASLSAIAAIAGGLISPEQVGEYAVRLQGLGAQIGSVTTLGLTGILARYGLPAWNQYRQTRLASLIQAAVNAHLEVATSPVGKR